MVVYLLLLQSQTTITEVSGAMSFNEWIRQESQS